MSVLFIIVILVAAALLLFALEAFVFPGFGICGIGAIVCLVAADVLICRHAGTTAAIVAIVVSTIIVVGGLWWFAHSKAIDRVALHSTISSTAATTEQLSVRVGDEGRALTRLALIGNADIGGRQVEVKSDGGFIDEGTPVVVTLVNDGLVLVRPKEPAKS